MSAIFLNKASPLRRGLLGWWPLSGDLNDHSGLGNNAANGVTGNPRWCSGLVGPAYLNTSTTYVNLYSVPYFTQMGTGIPFSISLWVNDPGTTTRCAYIGNSYFETYGFLIGTYAANNVIISIEAPSQDKKVSFTTSSVYYNTWANYIASYNGTTLSLYTNGGFVTSTSGFSVVAAPANGTYIGRSTQGGWVNYVGAIQNVAIWSRALSAAEAHEMYRNPRALYGAPPEEDEMVLAVVRGRGAVL